MRASLPIAIMALAIAGFSPAVITPVITPVLAQPQPPLVKVEGLRQISPHVQIIPDNSVPAVPNVGYIVGDRAVLVVDTGLGPPNGAAVYELAKKLAGSKAIYLVTTHVHPEHDLGAQAFPAAVTLIRSTDQVKDIAEFGLQLARVFSGRSAVHAELLKDTRETWQTENQMDFVAHAMGQRISGSIEIGTTHVQVSVTLPMLLAIFASKLEPQIKAEGQKLLKK